MAESSPPGPPRPPVGVRYYPRRVARPRVAGPLSPGRALHLADDPERVALARHTAEQEVFVAVDPAPAALRPPVPAAGRRGWWGRLIGRLKRSD